MSNDNEDKIIEMIQWLEDTAHDADFAKIVKRMRSGELRRVGYTRIANELLENGRLEERLLLPLDWINSLIDEPGDSLKIKEYFDAVVDDTIKIHLWELLGETYIVVARIYSIPTERRESLFNQLCKDIESEEDFNRAYGRKDI